MYNLKEYCENTIRSDDCGNLIKLACKRFLSDLERPDLYFDSEAVERCLRFIGYLHHFQGVHSGKPFQLQPWQIFIVANIIGWKLKETGQRRFQTSYIEVARKNGKTFLASALCLYFLVADKENGAEVDLAANSKEQANICFEYCKALANQIDTTNRALRCYKWEISFSRANSKLKCFSADESTLDGFNASFAVVDEYHAAKNSKVRDVIKSSQGMRRNPHLLTITTAGFDKNSPCYALRQTGVEILNHLKEDDTAFFAIFSPDEGDNWKAENTWKKANPNYGVTVFPDYLKAQIVSATNNSTEETSVKTKNLNIWCEVSDVWLPDYEVIAACKDFTIQAGEIVYIGVDLAATGDLTAVCYLVVREGIYYFKVDYYIPEAAVNRGKNSFYYKQWKKDGFLKVTAGNVTDYDAITADIIKTAETCRIACISYDSWNATQWALDCTAKGLPLLPYSQSIGNFNRPTKTFERLLLGKKVVLENSPVTRFCFSNVKLKVDSNGNTKPSKENYTQKIDGVIAILMSLGGYLQQPQFNNKIYTL